MSTATSVMMPPGSEPPSSTAIPLAVVAGFFFCARVGFTELLVRSFRANEQSGSAVSVALSLLLCAVVAVDSLTAVRQTQRTPLKPPRWVLLYLAFMGLSLTWSAAASVRLSSVYWFATAADIVTTVLLLRRSSAEATAVAMMKGFIVGACVIAVAAWIMPAEYDLRLGDQDYLNANTIANVCAFGFFFAQYVARSTRTRWSAVSALLAMTILRTLSKATAAAFLVSAAILLIADRSMRRRTKVLIVFASIFAVLSLWGLFEAYYDLYTTTANQAETLTGRTAIWSYAFDAIPDRLLLGHGYDSMWKVVPAFGTFQARHAENEVLQQLYAYGVAGFALAAAVYGSLFRHVRQLARSTPLRLPATCLLVYVLIRGLAEAEPFDLLLPLWTAVLLNHLIQVQSSHVTAPEGARCLAEAAGADRWPA